MYDLRPETLGCQTSPLYHHQSRHCGHHGMIRGLRLWDVSHLLSAVESDILHDNNVLVTMVMFI